MQAWNGINKHIKFLKENFENQEIYSSKFSKILQEMDIFQGEDNDVQARAQDYSFEGVRPWHMSFCSAGLASCSAKQVLFCVSSKDTSTCSE